MADISKARRTEPSIPVTDPRFVYTPACATDIRLTFERARREMAGKKPLQLRRIGRAA